MENNELEQVQEVVEIAEVSKTNNLVKVGAGVLGITALVGFGYLVYRKIKARKMQSIDTVEYSVVEPNNGETEE